MGWDHQPTPTIGAVVVHHEAPADLDRCLRSLTQADPPPDRVVVVDNSETSEAREAAVGVARAHSAELVASGWNQGFAAGCNRGADRLGEVDHLFFLNQDATIEPGLLGALARHLDQHPDRGAVCPLITTGGGRVWFAGGELDRTWGRLVMRHFGQPVAAVDPVGAPTGWVNGCAVLVRGEAWREVAGFNPRYFLYWEDVDLSVRLVRAGWSLGLELGVAATHHRDGHRDGLRTLTPTSIRWSIASRLRFVRAELSRRERWTALPYTAVNAARLLWLGVRWGQGGPGAQLRAVASGLGRGMGPGASAAGANRPAEVLFVDHTGQLGGGELALADLVEAYRDRCRVVLLEDGPFRPRLEGAGARVTVVTSSLAGVRRESGLKAGVMAAPRLVVAALRVAAVARRSRVVYANSQKALVVGSLAAAVARRPLVFHLHDLLTPEHFSTMNRWLSVRLANRWCRRVVTNSEASRRAFIDAGGRADRVSVVPYGFRAGPALGAEARAELRAGLGAGPDDFLVGCFSRLSPWKGQEVLVRALGRCPESVVGVLVGKALFGEEEFVAHLQAEIDEAGLGHRVVLTGFRHDVPALMAACDLVAHTSTSPEPFGRVIVEAMLAGTPVVATRAGGPPEIIEHERTGWLVDPGDDRALAEVMMAVAADRAAAHRVAAAGFDMATERFSLESFRRRVAAILDPLASPR